MALVARWPVRRSAILVLSYYPSRVRITFLRALSCGLVLNDFTVNWVGCGLGSRQSSVVVAGFCRSRSEWAIAGVMRGVFLCCRPTRDLTPKSANHEDQGHNLSEHLLYSCPFHYSRHPNTDCWTNAVESVSVCMWPLKASLMRRSGRACWWWSCPQSYAVLAFSNLWKLLAAVLSTPRLSP